MILDAPLCALCVSVVPTGRGRSLIRAPLFLRPNHQTTALNGLPLRPPRIIGQGSDTRKPGSPANSFKSRQTRRPPVCMIVAEFGAGIEFGKQSILVVGNDDTCCFNISHSARYL